MLEGRSTSFMLQKLIGNSGPSGVERPGSSSWGSTGTGDWDPSVPAEQPPSEEEWTVPSLMVLQPSPSSPVLWVKGQNSTQKRRPQFVSGRGGAHCWAGREASWYLGAQPPPRPPDVLVLLSSRSAQGLGSTRGLCPSCCGLGASLACGCFLPKEDFMFFGHQLGTGCSLTMGGPKCSDHSSSPHLPCKFAGPGMAQCF